MPTEDDSTRDAIGNQRGDTANRMKTPSDNASTTTKQQQERSIIVIEDNAPLRTEIGKMLENGGWWVKLCPDGSSAIQSLTYGFYDAALVDFNLPDIRGHVVTELIRTFMPRACIIGISFRDREEEFLAAGADAFLLKPFDIDDVNRIARMGGSWTSDMS